MNHEEEAREFEQGAANARWTASQEGEDPERAAGLLIRANGWENEARKIRFEHQDQIRALADATAGQPLQHGRRWSYNLGCRCDPCIESNRKGTKRKDDYHRSTRVEIDGRMVTPAAPHGTITGYTHHCCRCGLCAQARRDYYENRPRRVSA